MSRRRAAFVVDTNVAVVANGDNEQASASCEDDCREALTAFTSGRARLVIDDGFAIFDEYRSRLSLSGQPGVGDMFLQWVHDNQFNAARCERVRLTPHDGRGFEEFPAAPDLGGFDGDDRKFAAAARTSRSAPRVLNAVDSDWWDYERCLAANGVAVEHLCRDQVDSWRRSRAQK